MEDKKTYTARIIRKSLETGKFSSKRKTFKTEKEAFDWVTKWVTIIIHEFDDIQHVEIEEKTYCSDGLVASSNTKYYYEW